MKQINKKTAILLAAVKIFARDGFKKATIDEIVEKAGVAKGTAYYYFKSKQEIFEAIVSEGLADFEKKIGEAVGKGGDVIDKIKKAVEAEQKYILKYRDFFDVFLSQLIKKAKRFEALEKLIDEGKNQEVLRLDLESKDIANAIFWMVAMTTISDQDNFQKDFILKGILA
jgi:AcrR family transcriptional regulator